jgi:hypothetical protein
LGIAWRAVHEQEEKHSGRPQAQKIFQRHLFLRLVVRTSQFIR